MLGLNREYINIENLKKILYIVPEMPKQAVIELTNICNLNCKMCPRKYFKRPKKHMNFDVYKYIINSLNGIEEIMLIGYGEPLLHPDIIDAIKYAKFKGFKVSLVTNGYQLSRFDTQKYNDFIHSGLDCIRFSIDSIHQNSNAFGHLSNERMLDWLYIFILKSKIEVIINPVLYKSNYEEIIPLIYWAEECKADQVDIAHFNSIVGNKGEHLEVRKEIELYKKIKRMNFNIKVTTLYDRYFGLRRLGYRFMTKCPMSYDVIYIRLDGTVSPCSCGLPNEVFGDLFKDKLRDIWNNSFFKSFRAYQNLVCKKCTLFKL